MTNLCLDYTAYATGDWREFPDKLEQLRACFRPQDRHRIQVLSQAEEGRKQGASAFRIVKLAGYIPDQTEGIVIVIGAGRGSAQITVLDCKSGNVLVTYPAPGFRTNETAGVAIARKNIYDLILDGILSEFVGYDTNSVKLVVGIDAVYHSLRNTAAPITLDYSHLPSTPVATAGDFATFLGFGHRLGSAPMVVFRNVMLPPNMVRPGSPANATYKVHFLSKAEPAFDLGTKKVALLFPANHGRQSQHTELPDDWQYETTSDSVAQIARWMSERTTAH